MKLSIIKKSFVLTILIGAYTLPALAQTVPVLPSSPSQVPIAGGLGILAVAGGAYALKKLRNRQE